MVDNDQQMEAGTSGTQRSIAAITRWLENTSKQVQKFWNDLQMMRNCCCCDSSLWSLNGLWSWILLGTTWSTTKLGARPRRRWATSCLTSATAAVSTRWWALTQVQKVKLCWYHTSHENDKLDHVLHMYNQAPTSYHADDLYCFKRGRLESQCYDGLSWLLFLFTPHQQWIKNFCRWRSWSRGVWLRLWLWWWWGQPWWWRPWRRGQRWSWRGRKRRAWSCRWITKTAIATLTT